MRTLFGFNNHPQAVLGGSGVEVVEVALNSRIQYLLVELKEGTTREQLEGIKPDFAACLSAAKLEEVMLVIVTAKGLTGYPPPFPFMGTTFLSPLDDGPVYTRYAGFQLRSEVTEWACWKGLMGDRINQEGNCGYFEVNLTLSLIKWCEIGRKGYEFCSLHQLRVCPPPSPCKCRSGWRTGWGLKLSISATFFKLEGIA